MPSTGRGHFFGTGLAETCFKGVSSFRDAGVMGNVFDEFLCRPRIVRRFGQERQAHEVIRNAAREILTKVRRRQKLAPKSAYYSFFSLKSRVQRRNQGAID